MYQDARAVDVYDDDLELAIEILVEEYGRKVFLGKIGPALLLVSRAIDDDRMTDMVRREMKELLRGVIH